MKQIGSILVMIAALGSGTRVAIADTQHDVTKAGVTTSQMWQHRHDGSWLVELNAARRCGKLLDALDASGVPASTTTFVKNATPEFAAGDHTLAELRATCTHAQRDLAIADTAKWMAAAKDEVGKATKHSYLDSTSKFVTTCLTSYDAAIAAGATGDEPVQVRDWSGSLRDGKAQFCAAAKDKLAKLEDAQTAPFKKLMKGKKLAMILKMLPDGYILPGGASSIDAAKLAAANVWFDELSSADGAIECANGSIHTLRRYAFDARGELTSSTQHAYCGNPPASAYH